MYFAQITDLHVVPQGKQALGAISTNECLAAAVAHLNALDPQPSFLAITGDLVHSGAEAEYEALRDLLAPLTMPIYVIPGNHDDRERLRACFAEAGYFAPDSEFLHYVVERHPLRLIFLDTVMPGQAAGAICPRRLGWLAKRLAEAPDVPTILFMHHPPVQVGIGHMDAMRCTNDSGLGYLVESYACVDRILCGHVHRPITTRWSGTVVTVGPSTAHAVALDLRDGATAGWTREPPAVSLHVWQPGVGLISHLSYVGDYPAYPVRKEPA